MDPLPSADDGVRAARPHGAIAAVALPRPRRLERARAGAEPREGAWWDASRIGIGPPLLRTEHGWLLIYHGVKDTVSGSVYRIGLALTALDEPTRVLHRLPNWIFGPLTEYEREGDVPNVVFPCGFVHDEASDEIRLYYGAADTSICVATARLSDLLEAVLSGPSSPACNATGSGLEQAVLLRRGAFLDPALLQRLLRRLLVPFFGFC